MKKHLLITLSGARPEILAKCPTERVKFESLGLAILITSCMACVSMWFALTSALGINPFGALPVALLWGLIIMGIDRWLVTSMPVGGAKRWTIVTPRLLMALLLGTLISTPIVLRVFQSEINTQVQVIKGQQASAYLSQQAHSQVGKQVAYWRKQVTTLANVIDSGGTVAAPTSSDPELQRLTAQRTAAEATAKSDYQQWQCQLYGGAGCTRQGNGPLAKASEQAYNEAQGEVDSLTSQIKAREAQLSATGAVSQQTRVQQAKASLVNAQHQLSEASARQQVLQRSFDARNESTNGLLIRLQALSQLTDKGFTLAAARFLLFLLFLVIECLPVTVKLIQQPGNYEKILQATADREFKEARRQLRSQFPGAAAAAGSAGGAAGYANGAPPSAGLRQIWQQPGPSAASWAPTVTAAAAPARPSSGPRPGAASRDALTDPTGDTQGHSRLDDLAIRRIEDTRNGGRAWPGDAPGDPAEAGLPGGGMELHYGDNE